MDRYFEAISRFQAILDRARATDIAEPTAFTLATCGDDGRPTARVVLLKQASAEGFVFYTNTLSRKGRQLAENPRAAMCFHWQPLVEQVLVEGSVSLVDPEEADAYWASRPRLSQLGGAASRQSQPLASRAELEARVEALEREYRDRPVPRPAHWTGYRLEPDFIEFWAGREGRLHDRDRYWWEDGAWRHTLVNP